MTKFRRALIAILAFVGLTAVSLGTGSVSAIVPQSEVVITISKSCIGGGWQVDYTANSVNSALPWKNMTPNWLPTINTYQANTIPFTRSTGVLPFSQVTAPPVSIDVVWNDSGDETTDSDTTAELAQPDCEVPATTTTPPGDTTIVDITNPATTATPDTAIATIPNDGTTCITDDEFCVGNTTTVAPITDFPVTGSDNGGLLIGGILLVGGAGAMVASRRKPKHV